MEWKGKHTCGPKGKQHVLVQIGLGSLSLAFNTREKSNSPLQRSENCTPMPFDCPPDQRTEHKKNDCLDLLPVDLKDMESHAEQLLS